MFKNMEREKEIIDLYLNGMTMPKIGRKFNVSRQRILQILQRNEVYRISKNKLELECKKSEIIELRNAGLTWSFILRELKIQMSIGAFLNNIKSDFELKNMKKGKGEVLFCRICKTMQPRNKFYYNKKTNCLCLRCRNCENKRMREYHKKLKLKKGYNSI